jgi:ribosome biogenesis GTPase A
MWPKIEHPDDGLMLAASHIIGTKAYIESEVAIRLAEIMLERYRKVLVARYGFANDAQSLDGVGVIEGVAAKRGFKLKGGDFDFDKAALALLGDYRSGALGRVSLETPSSRATRPPASVRNGDALENNADGDEAP